MTKNIKSEKYLFAILIVFLTIVFDLIIFTNKIYLTGDLQFHLNRLIGIYECVKDGQIIPRVYPLTNNGFGYASPQFYCDLFLYPFALLQFFGISYIACYKILFVFYTLIGNVLMYVFLKSVFKNKYWIIASVLVLYSLSNYRMMDGLSRSALGEFLALNFLPLLMLAVYRVLYEKKDSYVLLSLGFISILFSHNISFILYCLLFGIILLFFIITNYKDKVFIKRTLCTVAKATILALLLSAWYLLPMLEQKSVQDLRVFTNGLLHLERSLLGIRKIVDPLMLLDNQLAGMTPGDVNLFGLILFVSFAISLFINRKDKNVLFFSLLTIILVLVSGGKIPLYLIRQTGILQFSFRWYILILPLALVVASKGYYNKFLFGVIIIFSALNTLYFSYQILENPKCINQNITRNEMYDINKAVEVYNDTEISGAEYLPITIDSSYVDDSLFIKEYYGGEFYSELIGDYSRLYSKIAFNLDKSDSGSLMLPLTYYKGYKAYAIDNDKKMELEVKNIDLFHRVGIDYLEGNYIYTVHYEGTLIQKLSSVLSVTTVILMLAKSVKRKQMIK